MALNTPGQLSPDGAYYWDGQQWVTTLSKDGAHRWNGSAWVPVAAAAGADAADPATPPIAPQPVIRTAATPYGPPVAQPARGLGFQFGGSAAWSIGFGLASLLAPLFASFYFILLPLFGLYRGYTAVRVGRTAGGVIGIVLNVLGGIMSLIASGLILR